LPARSLASKVDDRTARPPPRFELTREQFDRRPLPGRARPLESDGEGLFDGIGSMGQVGQIPVRPLGQGWASMLFVHARVFGSGMFFAVGFPG
jgi:hypothetical protein